MIETAEAYGLKFAFPSHDQAVGRCLRESGEFARPIVAIAAQLGKGGTIIDVGANIGAIALPVAAQAQRVIAVEPHAGLFDLLTTNIAANKLTNVAAIHAALGDKAGTAAFPTPSFEECRNFGATGFHTDDAPTLPVQVTTLDRLADETVQFVKIDVEGHEPEVLTGAQVTLGRIRPSWMIEKPRDADRAAAVLHTLWRFDYVAYWFYAPFVTWLAARTKPTKPLLGDMNFLAIPRERSQPTGMITVLEGARPPIEISAYPYLRSFGFRID